MATQKDQFPPPPSLELPSMAYRWVVLVFVSLPMMANYYIYDSINPLVDILTDQLGFTDGDIGALQAGYSAASILTLLLAGLIIDRFGTKKSILVFAVICFLGALISVLEGTFMMMMSGRVVLGLGAEALIVAVTTSLAKWFKGKELGFAFGINLMIARGASWAADNSPSWASSVYYPEGTGGAASWEGPLMIAVVVGAIGIVGAILYWGLESRAEARYQLGKAGEIDKLDVKQGFRFGASYWFIVGLCFTFYSAIFPFRTFAVKFFMHTQFADLAPDLARESAGFYNGLLPLSTILATPIFGYIVDRVGKRSLFMVLGSVLLMPVYLIMAYTDWPLWIPLTMMGVAFSLIPAVMWPSVAYIVDEKRLGTAYALMTLIQQVGFLALNLMIGKANEFSGAGADNPEGYALGMWIFSILGFVGLTFAYLLRKAETGPGAHGLETIKAGAP